MKKTWQVGKYHAYNPNLSYISEDFSFTRKLKFYI
jgi:hypothetical protein